MKGEWSASGVPLLEGGMNHMGIEAAEHTQTIVWVVEAVTFVTAGFIAWLVWRVSKRASDAKKAQKVD